MSSLSITSIQTELIWEKVSQNLSNFDKLMQSISVSTDLIVLPEMFSTAYTMTPQNVAGSAPLTIDWMAQKAAQYQAVVTGSIVVEDDGAYYNRLIWMQPDGAYQFYDKKHLFGLAKENQTYQAGKERKIFSWKGWNILPLICYDLRFPEWSRYDGDYDLLIYVASWPVYRVNAWKTLIQARAIENQCYAVGVNRIGKDENNYEYSGQSMVVDYSGKIISSSDDIQQSTTVIIDLDQQNTFREKLPFLRDRDAFTLV